MLELHHMWLASASGIVRFALDAKGLEWSGKIHTPSVTDLRIKLLAGKVQVPVLVDDGQVIQGSDHILTHLDGKAPTPNLMGETEEEKQAIAGFYARYEGWLPLLREEVVSRVVEHLPGVSKESPVGFLPDFLRIPIARVVITRFANKYAFTKESIDQLRSRTLEIFSALETELRDRQHFVGDRLTAADLIVSELLLSLRPPAPRYAPVGPHTRAAYTADWLTEDKIGRWAAWRDALYAQHRQAGGSP